MAECPEVLKVPDEAVDELHQNAEKCLLGTVQLAIAADQRATTMAGIFGAGSIALLATAATLRASSNEPDLIWAAIITAIILYIATLFCAWSARPVDIFIGGYEPRLFIDCASDPIWMKKYATTDMQVRIDKNRRTLLEASKFLSIGAGLATLSPLFGATIYFMRHLFF